MAKEESIAEASRRLEAQLHAEGLGAKEFEWDQARPQVFDETKHKHFHRRAEDFLEEHTWPDTPAGRLDRACWELHVARRSNRQIAAELQHLGAYRSLVDKIVARLKRLADGRITRKRRPGRQRDDEARGAGCLRVTVRMNEAEEGALLYAVDKLRARRELPPAREPVGRKALKRIGPSILRAALLQFARRI